MKGRLCAVIVLVVAAAGLTTCGAAAAAPAPTAIRTPAAANMKIFSDRVIKGPEGITAGPEGALWYVNNKGISIGSITGTSWGGHAAGYGYATVAYSIFTGSLLWAKRDDGPHGDNTATSMAVRAGRVFVTGASRAARSGSDYATIAYQG